jgi:hypothetical protein
MSDYPLISDHGLIGDLQTSALVTKDGTIDFFCAPRFDSPRFDSPRIFASLLDARKGGSFRIAPRLDDDYTTTQMYFPQSACLITRFMTDAGVGELIDFMPIDNPTITTDNHKIARGVRCLRGLDAVPPGVRTPPRLRPPDDDDQPKERSARPRSQTTSPASSSHAQKMARHPES